jgi:hypothetical protein
MRRHMTLLSAVSVALCAATALGADTLGLSPDAGDWGDRFGQSIAADGNEVLVGAPGHDQDATDAGTAFVYLRRGIFLPLQAELRPSDPSSDAHFGASVGIFANVAVVGAPDDSGVGAVYVFERTDGVWTQTVKLSGTSSGDRFGASVAFDGASIVIGAPGRSESSGAVFVYVRDGSSWSQQAEIESPVYAGGFGTTLGVLGDRFVAGIPYASESRGVAAVYVRYDTEWSFEATLEAPDIADGDETGGAVAIGESRVVIGAPKADLGEATDAGAADVFAFADGVWTWSARLVSPTPLAYAQFGSAVAVGDGGAAVGSPYRDGDFYACGTVDLFAAGEYGWSFVRAVAVPASSDWDESGAAVTFAGGRVVLGVPGRGAGLAFVEAEGAVRETTASDTSADAAFGWSAGISGDTAIVGAYGDDGLGTDSGAAYVFVRSGGAWVEQQKLTAQDGAPGDWFGWSVSISGDTALVGAYGDDERGSDAGAAYVFVRSEGVWTQQAKVTAADGEAGDWFGRHVALSFDTALVAAQKDDDVGIDAGSAYVYVRTDAEWTEQQKLTAPDGAASDSFGRAIAIDGDTVLVGALQNDAAGTDAGAAYVFLRQDGAWSVQQKLTASDAEDGDWFGSFVALDGETALVAAHGDDDRGNGAGAAYVFERADGWWTERQKLTASDGGDGRSFGWDVAVSGDVALVGAYGDDAAGDDAGTSYAFVRSNGTWNEVRRLSAGNGAAGDRFGCEIALDDGTAIFGAYGRDVPSDDAGTAYVVDVDGGLRSATTGPVPAKWTVGVPLAWESSVAGGTPPIRWRPSGSLPAGLVLDADTGAVHGTPAAAGNFTFAIECIDAWGETSQAGGAFVVSPRPSVTTTALAGWTALRPFERTLVAAGGTSPQTWSVASGDVPPGTSLAENGTLSGTATQAGNYSFVVRVVDAVGAEATATVSLTIFPLPAVVTTELPAWTENRPYRQTLSGSGGTYPFTWSVVSGSLPTDGTLDGATGDVGGTAKPAGLYSFTVLVTDAAGATATRTITARTSPWPQITTGSFPTAAAGRPFDAGLGVTGGTPPYRWTPAGSQPDGLVVDPAGHLAGTAAVVGTADVSIQVVDAAGAAATRTIPFVCVPRADLTSAKLASTHQIALGSGDIVRYVELLGDTEADFTLTVKSATAARVTLSLLDAMERPLDLAPYTKKRKSTTAVKGFPVPATGRYYLVLHPDPAFEGTVDLAVALTATKTWKGRGLLSPGGPPATFEFHALPGSTLVVTAKSRRRSAAIPIISAFDDALGEDLLVYGDVDLTRTGAKFRSGPALLGGDYRVAFALRDGEAGEIEWTVVLKSPKGYAFELPHLAVEKQ